MWRSWNDNELSEVADDGHWRQLNVSKHRCSFSVVALIERGGSC